MILSEMNTVTLVAVVCHYDDCLSAGKVLDRNRQRRLASSCYWQIMLMIIFVLLFSSFDWPAITFRSVHLPSKEQERRGISILEISHSETHLLTIFLQR